MRKPSRLSDRSGCFGSTIQRVSSVLTLLHRVGRWLGRFPSLGYGLLYLAMIPSFALIYSSMSPRAFYHATAQYEPTLQGDADSILQQLRSQLLARIGPGPQGGWKGWTLDRSEFMVSNLKIEGERGSFRMRLRLWKKVKEGTITMVLSPTVDFGLRQEMVVFSARTGGWTDYHVVTIQDKLPLPVRPEVLFPGHPDIGNSYAPMLALSRPLQQRLWDFAAATKGFPSRVSGHLGRMFYLSAITITTLGYGDILPLTGWARFWTALEAVVGAVLVGLFLNSLATRREDEDSRERSRKIADDAVTDG